MKAKEIINLEKKLYFSGKKEWIKEWLSASNKYVIWSYVKNLRKEEQFRELADQNKLYLCLLLYYRRRKNILGRKLGFDIPGGGVWTWFIDLAFGFHCG